MKILKYLLFTFLIITISCKQKGISKSQKTTEISKFKTEMITLADSTSQVLDSLINKLENDIDSEPDYTQINALLQELEMRIDKKSKSFQKTAIELKLTEKENSDVFKELKENFKLMMDKYQKIKSLGIKF